MKKIVIRTVCFLLFVLISSSVVFGKEVELGYTEEQFDIICRRYNYSEELINPLFCSDTNMSYRNLIRKMEGNKALSIVLNAGAWMIGQYPDEKRCTEVLLTMITLQSSCLSDQLE